MADPYGYDELPYPSAPYPYTHPDHLATLATLFGLETAAIEDSRVLEVGCADGANLIPMALTLPRGHCVGIDLSERQIAAGRRMIERLMLTNTELRHGDLSEFTADEPFDWIIAHGFYSWTPRETRSRLLFPSPANPPCSRFPMPEPGFSGSSHAVAPLHYLRCENGERKYVWRYPRNRRTEDENEPRCTSTR